MQSPSRARSHLTSYVPPPTSSTSTVSPSVPPLMPYASAAATGSAANSAPWVCAYLDRVC